MAIELEMLLVIENGEDHDIQCSETESFILQLGTSPSAGNLYIW